MVDPQRTKYAVVRGLQVQDEAAAYLSTSMATLIDEVQGQENLIKPVSHYTLFEANPRCCRPPRLCPMTNSRRSIPKALRCLYTLTS